MIKDFIFNMTLIISMISLLSQYFKKFKLQKSDPLKVRMKFGILSGVLAIILITFGVQIDRIIIIDYRNVVIVSAAIYGGKVPVIICSIMIIIFRIAYYGVNKLSIAAVFVTSILALGCILISNLKLKNSVKWIYSIIFTLSISSIVLGMFIKGKINIIYFLSIYIVSTTIVSLIVYRCIEYWRIENEHFRTLETEASKDFLTGLNNVRNFDSLYKYAKFNAKEKKEKLSLLMIDIDFFKKVNDTYGHAQGHVILKELAKILINNCRTVDVISRNGGEEFTVLLLDCTGECAIQKAENIRKTVEKYPFKLSDGTSMNITISIGVAAYPDSVDNINKLLDVADMELYNAKRAGRNRVYYKGECRSCDKNQKLI